jgi:hypothetical protein
MGVLADRTCAQQEPQPSMVTKVGPGLFGPDPTVRRTI